MARPLQQVQIYSVQNRRGAERRKLPYVVRWTIDGRHRSRSYRTKAEAERYRTELLKAVHAGDRFELDTGEPSSWSLPLADLGVHRWVRRWLAEQWPEWQPRTRASAVEALARGRAPCRGGVSRVILGVGQAPGSSSAVTVGASSRSG